MCPRPGPGTCIDIGALFGSKWHLAKNVNLFHSSGMRSDRATVLAVAAGGFLLIDTVRGWLPTMTTIFGSAGSTPDWVFVLFALAWVVPPVVVVPLALRRWGGVVPVAAIVVEVLARIVLQTGVTGQVQLYASCVAVLAGFCWLVAAATRGWPGEHVATGFGGAVALTVLLGLTTESVDLMWLSGVVPWVVLIAVAAVAVLGTRSSAQGRGGGALWFAFGPALLLGTQIAGTLGRTWVAAGTSWWPGALLVVAAAAGVVLRPPRFVAPVALVVGVALADLPRTADNTLPGWALVGQLLVALSLTATLAAAGTAGRSAKRRGLAGFAGIFVFFLLVAGYNTSFDSFGRVWLPAFTLVTAVLVAVVGRGRAALPMRGVAIGCAVVAVAGVVAAVVQTPKAVAPAQAGPQLRVVHYNIRSAISAFGRFDPDAIADQIAAQHPDVVNLQEVDRGMLITGGHDALRLIADRLGMDIHYFSAKDPLWGLAILTRLPVHDVVATPMTEKDIAPQTGILRVTVDTPRGPVVDITTHFQPGSDGIPRTEVDQLAALVSGLELPAVVTGDFNLEPGDPRMLPMTRFTDGLAQARPLPTSPAEAPRKQIDNVFVTGELTTSDIVAPRTTASDHLMVAVTVAFNS